MTDRARRALLSEAHWWDEQADRASANPLLREVSKVYRAKAAELRRQALEPDREMA